MSASDGGIAVPPHNALDALAPGLPAEWYYNPAHHRVEMETIWRHQWVYVCRGDSLAAPRSYRTLEIGDQSVVVVRAPSGELRAFYNTCRHRGSLICTQAEGRLPTDYLVCPYHQWAYGAEDGALARVSSFAEPEGFDRGDFPLFKVAVGEWRGFVFVNLDPTASWDADSVFQRPPDNLVNFPLEEMVVAHRWETVIECNWKTFWENFNECLHCPGVHPELVRLVPLYTRRIMNPRDVPDWPAHAGSDDPRFKGGVREGAETWSANGSAQGATIPSLTPADLERGHTYAASWPSVYIGGYADHVRSVQMHPVGPERTRLIAEWLLPPATLAREDYDLANIVDFGVLVMEQDGKACELNQRGLHAAPMTGGVLMPEEYVVKRFHDWLRAQL